MSIAFTGLPAHAHVVVRPAEIGAAAFQTFTIGVPVERDLPTMSIRLLIPEGLRHVTPNVKPGWTISTKKEGAGEDTRVTEVAWTGGTIPAGQRDDFLFSAQAPAEETSLQWKAYQTYGDGSVVAWDLDPATTKDQKDFSTNGPSSITRVLNDVQEAGGETGKDRMARILGGIALVVSVLTFLTAGRRRQQT